jgi:hypothetical protein
MQRGGDIPRSEERRAVGRWGTGVFLGLGIGGTIGVVAGLLIGLIAFEGTGAILTSALGGAIFGLIVGGFIGGMSTLEDRPPGAEAGTHDPSLGRPGLTHHEGDGHPTP